MHRKAGKKSLDKKLIAVGCVLFLLLLANLSTIFLTRLDQFNLFHSYDRTYSLIDWNLPHIVSEFIDDDDKVDTVMYTGCVFLTTVSASTIPKGSQCKNNIVGNGETVGTQTPNLHKKLINSYVAQKGNSWDIVVHYLGKTKLYKIAANGELVEKKVPITLKLDSFLYLLSHLYAVVL